MDRPRPAGGVGARRAAIARIKVGQRELGLDEGTYRDLMKVVTGKTSAGAMSEAELAAVIEHMRGRGAFRTRRGPARAGGRRLAPGGAAAKARALWLALHHLAEVEDPGERALAAFARRQTGVEALEWLSPADVGRVIEALKGRLARAGVEPAAPAWVKDVRAWRAAAGLDPAVAGAVAVKARLLQAQWRALIAAGALRPEAGLGTWLMRHGASAPVWLSPAAADRAIEELGAWLRRVKGKKAAAGAPADEAPA